MLAFSPAKGGSKAKMKAPGGSSNTTHKADTSKAAAKYKAVPQPAMSSNLSGKYTKHAW